MLNQRGIAKVVQEDDVSCKHVYQVNTVHADERWALYQAL